MRKASIRRSVHLVLILASAMLTATSAPVWGINVWLSDETGFDFHDDPYARNEAIYISGEWDHYTFPCSIGHIYLVANDGTVWVTRQIENYEVRKTVQGCYGAGAFYGALLKLPPLYPGEYDIVMDEDEDGRYDPGVDFLLGDGPSAALKVIDQSLDQQVDVLAIKASATASAVYWYEVSGWMGASFDALGIVSLVSGTVDIALTYGSSLLTVGYAVVSTAAEIRAIPVSYDGVSTSLGRRLVVQAAENSAAVYADIAADPPDPQYTDSVELSWIPYTEEVSSLPLASGATRLRNNLAEQASIGGALRRSYEKFLGAEAAENYPYTLMQARAAREYCGLMLEALYLGIVELESLEIAVDSTGRADSTMSAYRARDLQQRVASAGFLPTELGQMAEAGMTPEETDSVRAAILSLQLQDLQDTTFRGLFAAPRLEAIAATAHYDSMATELDSVLAALEHGWTDAPRAHISAADDIVEGATLDLNGVSSADPRGGALDYAWDLDMDGSFDDGTTSHASFTPLGAGDRLVGLRVATLTGDTDVAYHRVHVTEANRMPRFTARSPDSAFVRVGTEATLRFDVEGSDPDGDVLTYGWSVDGLGTGSGSSLEYAWTAPGTHTVAVRLVDGSPLSADPLATWRVQVEASPGAVEDLLGEPPRTFQVHSAVPNPFVRAVSAAFDLDRPGRVKISIYSVEGRLVARIADREFNPGRYRIEWDGRDDSGVVTAPGVYYLLLRAGDRSAAIKLVRVS